MDSWAPLRWRSSNRYLLFTIFLTQTTPLKYRNAFYSEFAIVGIWLPVLVFLPESPVWYCKKGMHDKAKAALHRLTGNVEGYDEEYEYAVFRQDVEESEAVAAKSSSVSWLACFRGTNLRRTLISTIPFSLQVCINTSEFNNRTGSAARSSAAQRSSSKH